MFRVLIIPALLWIVLLAILVTYYYVPDYVPPERHLRAPVDAVELSSDYVPRCSSRAKMTKLLSERYNEELLGAGQVNDRLIVELFVSTDPDRSWTILFTNINSFSCIEMVGEGWEGDGTRGEPVSFKVN